MAAAGFAGVARYALPAAGCACVLAGIGVAALAGHLRAGARSRAPRSRTAARLLLALVLVVALAVPAAARVAHLGDQLREGTAVARAHTDLRAAIAGAGGAAALRRCALGGGWVAVNHTTQSALAWELGVELDRVARTMSRPGILMRAPRGAAAGAPALVTLAGPLTTRVLARAGAWTVLAVHPATVPAPSACNGRKASGPARRIPNI